MWLRMHFTAGYVPAGKSVEAFTQACMGVAKPIIGKPVNEISVAKLLGQMFRIAAEFEMETQPQLLLLQKTMMVTEGVGRMLNPNLNMWNLSRPLMESWAEEHFGATGKLKDAARQGTEAVRKFPQMLGAIENTVKNLGDPAGVKLHPDTLPPCAITNKKYTINGLFLPGLLYLRCLALYGSCIKLRNRCQPPLIACDFKPVEAQNDKKPV